MANSDNVLRAGLTPKHMDVEELVKCTDFVPKPFNSLVLEPMPMIAKAFTPFQWQTLVSAFLTNRIMKWLRQTAQRF